MDSVDTNTAFRVPSFAKQEAYNFDTTRESLDLYQELNAISEEIEQCRLKNC